MIIESLSEKDQHKLNNAVQFMKSSEQEMLEQDGALEQIKQLVRNNEQIHQGAKNEKRCLRHVNIASLILMTR